MKSPKAKNIVWIASYPKSGNTWIRILLLNYLRNDDKPIDINSIKEIPIFSSRSLFDENSPVYSSDLNDDEIDELRYDIFRKICEDSSELKFFKIHDAFYYLKSGKCLVPSENSFGVIYIVRNPFDVAVSYSYHSNITIEKSVNILCNDDAILASSTKRMDPQIRQKIFSWSLHVKSWLDNPSLPVLIVKYEDLLADTVAEFSRIVKFLKLEYDKARIEKAVKFSSFQELSNQELKNGFKEKPLNSNKFFRNGKVGSGINELNKEQKDRILSLNYDFIKKIGYL